MSYNDDWSCGAQGVADTVEMIEEWAMDVGLVADEDAGMEFSRALGEIKSQVLIQEIERLAREHVSEKNRDALRQRMATMYPR